jgi:capsular exopolysaccharide synthesis family protein
MYLLIGLLLGVVFAAGFVTLSEAVDRRVYGADDVPAHLGAPVLGVVPDGGTGTDLVLRTQPTSDRAEAYRSVLAALTFGRPDGVPRSLTITGLAAGGGVTSLVANIGLALASGGRSVVLIDANLRRPALHQVFELTPGPGLVEVLSGTCDLSDALREVTGTSLRVLPAGKAHEAAVDLLTTREAGELLLTIEQGAEVVLIDAPPILAAADGRFLAAQSKGVVVVADSERATRDQLLEAAAVVRQLGAVLLGVVLARATRRRRSHAWRSGRRHGVVQAGRSPSVAPLPQAPDSEAVRAAGPARAS